MCRNQEANIKMEQFIFKKSFHDSFKHLPEHCKREAGGMVALSCSMDLCTSSFSSTYTSTTLQSLRARGTTCFELSAILVESLETY